MSSILPLSFNIEAKRALRTLRNLPSSERDERIAQAVMHCATTAREDDPHHIPLFGREGIKESPELLQLVTRLATQYTDLLLTQLSAQAEQEKSSSRTQSHREKIATASKQTPLSNEQNKKIDTARRKIKNLNDDIRRFDSIEDLTLKELTVWNDHATECLKHYPEYITKYDDAAKAHDKSSPAVGAKPRNRLLGAIIQLSMYQVVPALTNIHINTADLDVPKSTAISYASMRYVDSLVAPGEGDLRDLAYEITSTQKPTPKNR